MAQGSILLAEELFERGDSAFLDELLRADQGGKKLRRFTLRWLRSRSDFARAARLELADRALDSGHARFPVKASFKAATMTADDELVAHHLAAFDRLLQRHAVQQSVWRWTRDGGHQTHVWVRVLVKAPGADAFTTRTRAYLQRRAWRYLKRLAAKKPKRYRKLACLALSLYTDETHFPFADSCLDCRGLCSIWYGESPHLVFDTRRGVELAPNSTLEQLTPAPAFPKIWSHSNAFPELLQLLLTARAAFVRGLVAHWLEQAHKKRLRALSLDELRPLLASQHGEAQALGAKLLDKLEGWEQVPVSTWLELLSLDNPQALTRLAALMERHVTPDRLTLTQCLLLSQSRIAAIAELGLRWAMKKGLHGEDDVTAAAALASAELQQIREQGLRWLKPSLVEKQRSLLLRELVDSRYPDVREVALEVSAEAPYQDDARFHAALAESPYGDVTDVLSQRLEEWHDRLDSSSLKHLLATVLLGVRRGGRAKRRSLRLLAEGAMANPERAAEMLPLVAVMLRSVREPERRAALGTLARAAAANDELRALVCKSIPELSFEEIASR